MLSIFNKAKVLDLSYKNLEISCCLKFGKLPMKSRNLTTRIQKAPEIFLFRANLQNNETSFVKLDATKIVFSYHLKIIGSEKFNKKFEVEKGQLKISLPKK
ncbi:hypothetical protein BpHYR1_039247 [Brachionus plicatilis]|uniref:Uncharacterized protein n=1 Tax=Brachionus plicatilis TaxID=10195 RepID=A0A3M7QU48_BRAPC|nr:hypothetical protein BpHYR1_039247 [Brachionus plicatilis]